MKRQEKCSERDSCCGPMVCFHELDRIFLCPLASCDTYDSHRHSNKYCTSVFPLASICRIKVLRKMWSMGMNTSDSRSLREMGLLIVGFYWLLYTPFASIYGTERQRDSYSWRSQRWDKKGVCLGRLHISGVSGVALELQWRRTAGVHVGRKRQKNDGQIG